MYVGVGCVGVCTAVGVCVGAGWVHSVLLGPARPHNPSCPGSVVAAASSSALVGPRDAHCTPLLRELGRGLACL